MVEQHLIQRSVNPARRAACRDERLYYSHPFALILAGQRAYFKRQEDAENESACSVLQSPTDIFKWGTAYLE